ncbi:hypothetical protein Trydic_g15410 [Trypoxylus dichotomus]
MESRVDTFVPQLNTEIKDLGLPSRHSSVGRVGPKRKDAVWNRGGKSPMPTRAIDTARQGATDNDPVRSMDISTEEELEVSIERKPTGASALEGHPIDLVMQELVRMKDNSRREVNEKLSFTRANQQAIRDGCDVVAVQIVRVLKESRTIERTLMSEKCRLVEELAGLKVEMGQKAKEGGMENIRKTDGSWTASVDETVEALFDKYFPGNEIENDREAEEAEFVR